MSCLAALSRDAKDVAGSDECHDVACVVARRKQTLTLISWDAQYSMRRVT